MSARGLIRRSAQILAGWPAAVILVPLCAAWIVRSVHLDDHDGRLFALQTLTPVLYLPAYVVLAAALVTRRRLVGCLAAVLAVSHLLWILPNLPLPAMATSGKAAGPALSIAAANVAATNPSPAALARSLGRLRTDVVVLEEFTEATQRALRGSRFLDRYPFHFEDPRSGFFGSAIYSTLRLQDARRIQIGGSPMVQATVMVDGRAVTVVAVHTMQPLADVGLLRRQLEELRHLAKESTGPLVLAGDFNAGQYNRPFRRLLETRLRDAHLDRRRGAARTWPAGRRVPPFVLLDHVLVSEEWVVHDVGEFGIGGSDHRGVETELQLKR